PPARPSSARPRRGRCSGTSRPARRSRSCRPRCSPPVTSPRAGRMRRPRTNPRLARARHLAHVEAAVRRYAPEVWTATRRLHARWLRQALAAARPLLDRLVIEARLYELEVEWLAGELAWLGYEISPDELREQPEVAWTLRRLAEQAPTSAGFLTTDPRR